MRPKLVHILLRLLGYLQKISKLRAQPKFRPLTWPEFQKYKSRHNRPIGRKPQSKLKFSSLIERTPQGEQNHTKNQGLEDGRNRLGRSGHPESFSPACAHVHRLRLGCASGGVRLLVGGGEVDRRRWAGLEDAG